MKEILQKYLTVLRKDRSRRKKLTGILCMLSVVVMLAVAWQLRFVGIAKTDEPTCGLEEHVHTKACMEKKLICDLKEGEPEPVINNGPQVHHHGPQCYEEVRTLHCTQKEHTHGDKCYEIRRYMDCGKEEHVHTKACFEIRDVLVCTEDHEHTAECYEQQEVAVCGKEAHTHNDDCYKVEKVLICTEPEHSHSDECYTIEKKLICGMEEGQVIEADPSQQNKEPKLHVHTDDCYAIVYTCGKEEHQHSLECYANLDADVETYVDWEKTLPEKLGRTWGESVLLVAQSQMGYKESTQNYKIAEDGETKLGYNRYGAWYLSPYSEWNTLFVGFCTHYAGIPEEAMPRHSGAFALSVKLNDLGLYEDASYAPEPGDIVFLQDEDMKNVNRVAVVASLGNMMVEDVKVPCITVIEGDREGAVAPYKYALDDETIQGYASMKAAYKRAEDLDLLPKDETQKEKTPEIIETPAPEQGTADSQISEEELDEKLSAALQAFAAKSDAFQASEKEGTSDVSKAVKLEMDKLFADIQNFYGDRYPQSGEADFVAYLNNNAEAAFHTYQTAAEAYPANAEEKKESSKTEPLKPETQKLLDVLAEKTSEYEKAVEDADEKQVRCLAEDMNLLYDQAQNLYDQQYAGQNVPGFADYVKITYPRSFEMVLDAEDRVGLKALDTALQGKLQDFDAKAEACAQAMNIGEDENAKNLKLDLDRLYFELKDLHAKRYPSAEKDSFDIFLNNNHGKAVKRYLAAVDAFPDAQLSDFVTYTDPVSGEARRILKMMDGMEVDVSMTGAICFPVKEKADAPLDARETTSNLETISKDGAVGNFTQTAAQDVQPARVHHHGPECYGRTDELICGLEEHVHTKACFQIRDVLTCTEDHEHTSECYEQKEVPVCGKEEHTHSDSCYNTELICGMEDGQILENVQKPDTQKPGENQQSKEEISDNRWENIQMNVVPVSEDAELAFAQYIGENQPDAVGMSMLDLKYQYNGLDLDVGDAQVDVALTPSFQLVKPEAPAMSFMMLDSSEDPAGPVISNEPVVESVSPALAAAAAPAAPLTGNPAENPVEVVILERSSKGDVKPVASMEVEADAEELPAIHFRAARNASYAAYTLTRGAADRKPLDPGKSYLGGKYPAAKAYPDHWGDRVKHLDGTAVTVETDKEVFDSEKSLRLIKDPYFQEAVLRLPADGGVYGFETPSISLGYVLRNYNVFTFDDAYISHVVGSAAIGGDAYYETNQGGTGSGADKYVPVPNFSPTYIMGSLRHIADKSFINPHQPVDNIKTVDKQLQIMVNAGNIENPDMGFPTYLGYVNKTENTFAGANVFVADVAGDKLPYYYTDQYIQFKEFQTNINNELKDDKLLTDLGGDYINVGAFGTASDFANDNFLWEKKGNEEFNRLYLRMGHVYKIESLKKTQIILVPPNGYPFLHDVNNTAKRASELALSDIHTVIYCNDSAIELPGVDPWGVSVPEGKSLNKVAAIRYYVSDISSMNPFRKDGFVNDCALVGDIRPDSTNATIMVFPNATSVEIGKRAGHLVAPKAHVYIPNTGDSYGSNICLSMHCPADLHMLPYAGKHAGVDKPVPVQNVQFLKRVEDADGSIRPPTKDEVFDFTIEEYSIQTAAVVNGPTVTFKDGTVANPGDVVAFNHYMTPRTWTGKNALAKIDFQSFSKKTSENPNGLDYGEQFPYEESPHGISGYIVNNNIKTPTYIIYRITEKAPSSSKYQGDSREYFLKVAIMGDYQKAAGTDISEPVTKTIGYEFYYLEDNKPVPLDADSAAVVFTNKLAGIDELPHTGGIGVLPFIAAGFAFMIIPVILVHDTRKKGRR